MNEIDFLSIGDIATDAYIRLKDAHLYCDLKHEHCQICLSYGEKVPYEFVEIVAAAGNAPNAAVSASRLGLKTGLVSDIGDDEAGRECLKILDLEKVDRSKIKIHSVSKTSHHFVLWYADERTILTKHEKFDYKLPELPRAKMVYLSSVGENSDSYHEEIKKFLENNPDTKLAFQPGTSQIQGGASKLEYFYKRADILAVNETEAKKIAGNDLNITDLLLKLRNMGPKMVLITLGKKGAYLSDETGNYFQPIYETGKPPYERTGAGDATTSTFAVCILKGRKIEDSLQRAAVNAASVVGEIGPQKGLLTEEKIDELISKTGPEFKTVKLS
jgi:ribokinase